MPSAFSSTLLSAEKLCAALEMERGSSYLLGHDLSIQYVNEAWRRFARENGAPELATESCLGQPVTRFFEPTVRNFFAVRFRRALERNEAWSHVYECASPGAYGKFRMRATPTARRDGLVVIHSPVVEGKFGESGQRLADDAHLYTDARGLIVQCSACSRVHNPATFSWDWAVGLVGSERLNVSHGICTTCDFEFYGPDSTLE
jgi:hypothetical protein